MAPTFLQKLAKATNPNSNQRVASESNISKPSGGRLSISRNRSPSVSINSTNGSNASTTNITRADNVKQNIVESSSDVPSITISTSSDPNHVVQHQGSADTLDTVSTQPNVTIIPPSPLVGTKELDSDSDQGHVANLPGSVLRNQARTTSASPRDDESVTPTPTPTKETQNPINSPISPATTITPTNTSADVKYQDQDQDMSSSNTGLVPPSLLRKQASNKSLKSAKKIPPSDIQIKPPPLPVHQRSATAPAETTFPSLDGQPETIISTISESPTELQHSVSKSESQNTVDSMLELSSSPKAKAKALGILQPEQSGSKMSLSGAGSSETKGSKRPWKRSTTRKPTGLASAIAASGLAIANHTMSPYHSAQAAAQISPPVTSTTNSGQKSGKSYGNLGPNGSSPGSPPYLSKSPAQSTISNRSGKNLKTDAGGTPRQGRARRASRATSAKSEASEYSARGTSTLVNSTASTATSVNGDESFPRPDYYSALELDADTSSDELTGSDLSGGEDEYNDDLIPVTGFAVASTKRNQDFHELFPTVPEGDYLIEDYGCALQREILIQGRLYISENHICFHANIFGWITDLSIPVYEITSLEKKMTAFVIPNAIQTTTRQAKYTFTSFLSRDTTFDVMYNIWRLSRPEDSISMISGSGGGSIEGAPAILNGANNGIITPVVVAAAKVPAAKRATICQCGKEGRHYSETPMDIIIPGTPEKINNMLFASGFIKDFMSENQKLLDIQMADWAPVSPTSKLLTQNLTYIKPLSGSLGPKQTKCEIKHEMVHCDFDEFISTVTTTRTPDVPSGGVFAVKTRTCVMWASPVSSKVVVTSQVEWSGRSFIKGIIEKSAIDGQKVYHADLEKAMRTYIQEHQSEFLPEGVEAAVIPDIEDQQPSITSAGLPVDEHHLTPEELKQRERERNARGLQWAWDTFDGAYQVAKRSTIGALELIKEAWDQSTSTTILWFVIVILVLSNLWTLMRMGSNKAEAARKLEARKVEEREKWVQSIVTALWEELSATKDGPPVILQPHHVPPTTSQVVATPSTILESVVSPSQQPVLLPMRSIEDVKEEIGQLRRMLQEMEGRMLVVKDRLAEYEGEPKINALD